MFRLLLNFAESSLGKAPTALALVDLDARLILSFLDHLEKDRKNGARSRNARLAALRSFLKYAAHYDLTALPVIEQALAIPMKRFDRPVLGFLSRQEMQAILDAPDPLTWAGSVRIGANVTSFEIYLRAPGHTRQTMTARSPDLSAYCSFRRFWREP